MNDKCIPSFSLTHPSWFPLTPMLWISSQSVRQRDTIAPRNPTTNNGFFFGHAPPFRVICRWLPDWDNQHLINSACLKKGCNKPAKWCSGIALLTVKHSAPSREECCKSGFLFVLLLHILLESTGWFLYFQGGGKLSSPYSASPSLCFWIPWSFRSTPQQFRSFLPSVSLFTLFLLPVPPLYKLKTDLLRPCPTQRPSSNATPAEKPFLIPTTWVAPLPSLNMAALCKPLSFPLPHSVLFVGLSNNWLKSVIIYGELKSVLVTMQKNYVYRLT